MPPSFFRRIISQVMQDHQRLGVPLPAGASEQMDYMRVVEHRRMEAATARQRENASAAAAAAAAAAEEARSRGPTTASFKDVVEGYAAQNGVMFLPKPGRQHEGKQARFFMRVWLVHSVCFVLSCALGEKTKVGCWSLRVRHITC